jgi:hypothetical protein
MDPCRHCRVLAARHPKATRRVAFLLFLALLFTALGLISAPVIVPGMCKVYP